MPCLIYFSSAFIIKFLVDDTEFVPQLALKYLRGMEERPSRGQGMFDIAFAVARAWLHSLSELYAIPRLLLRDVRTRKWDEIAGAMFTLKAGYKNSKRWRHALGYDPPRPSCQVTFFEEEYQQVAEEGDIVQRFIDSRNTERSLKAANMSILESRRGIDEAHTVGRLTQLAFVFLPLSEYSARYLSSHGIIHQDVHLAFRPAMFLVAELVALLTK